tara:strand:+ start:241 stop:675 length:435 start_codon:yes stop_codon:yes gene_type:complete
MIYTSGDWCIDSDSILTRAVFDFMCKKFSQIKDVVVEVNQVDLTDDNAFGFCQVDEDGEFLIHIHNDLNSEEYAITLIHELVHVKQTLTGLLDNDRREEEAVIWEKILSKEFWETFKGKKDVLDYWKNQDRIYALNSPTSPLLP